MKKEVKKVSLKSLHELVGYKEKGVYYIEFDSNMKYNNALTIKEIEKQAKSLEKDVEKITAYRNELTEKENKIYKKYTSYVFEKALEKGVI